jgi:hypothetical protein
MKNIKTMNMKYRTLYGTRSRKHIIENREKKNFEKKEDEKLIL